MIAALAALIILLILFGMPVFAGITAEDLLKAVRAAKKKSIPFLAVGDGTNILFSDKGFEGLIIRIKTDTPRIEEKSIFSGAGAKLISLVNLSLHNSLEGLEWAVGIPGTLGGAIYGNAQAFGERIGDSVKEVEVLDTEKTEFKALTREQCLFEPKNSIFKKRNNLIIVSAVLELKEGKKEDLQKKVKKYIDYRKRKHPLYLPSAGSVFINNLTKVENEKLLKECPELESFNKYNSIPSAYLIEKCGLKGKRIGGAKFSEQHANFIVNLGSAKAEDVLKLIEIAKKKVKDKFNINLKEEIQII